MSSMKTQCDYKETKMTKDEAMMKVIEFKKKLSQERPLNWLKSYGNDGDVDYKEPISDTDGEHVFIFNKYDSSHPEAIVVNNDGLVNEIYGAISTLYIKEDYRNYLGSPLTGERWIGTGPGRYQLFKKGIIKWEGTHKGGGNEDLAHPVIYKADSIKGEKKEDCIIASFDIRGFTKWAADKDIDIVHGIIRDVEELMQKHFAKPWFRELFIKGVGDGFMIVQEKKEYDAAKSDVQSEEQDNPIKYNSLKESRGFVCDFINALLHVINDAKPKLKEYGLEGVGIGIDIGPLMNILILGRWDYIGNAANNAAKLQVGAINTVVVSENCYLLMEKENQDWLEKLKKEYKIDIKSRHIFSL